MLSSPAPNTAKVCARRPTPPASRLISAIKGAVGDAQSVAVTLPLASDNGGSSEPGRVLEAALQWCIESHTVWYGGVLYQHAATAWIPHRAAPVHAAMHRSGRSHLQCTARAHRRRRTGPYSGQQHPGAQRATAVRCWPLCASTALWHFTCSHCLAVGLNTAAAYPVLHLLCLQRVLSFKEGAASVPAKGLCGKKWRVSGQWCNAAGCSDWCGRATGGM